MADAEPIAPLKRKQEQPSLPHRRRASMMCSKKPKLKNWRVKQNRGENRHMEGRLIVSHRNHFDRRRQLGE